MCNSFFDITLIVIMWKIYIALVSRLQYDGDSNTGVQKTCHNACNVTFLRLYLLVEFMHLEFVCMAAQSCRVLVASFWR